MTIMDIVPDCTVYTGKDAGEYNIKLLSENGSLNNYKVIHFATHGLWLLNLYLEYLGKYIQVEDINPENGFFIKSWTYI
jgi:hypothetical protein